MASNGVPTENRFEILRERENCRTLNNGQTINNGVQAVQAVSRDQFASSSWQDQMVLMFDELRFIRHEQVSCSRNILDLHQSVSKVNEKVGQVINTTNSHSDLLQSLAYKSIDMEARSRRNNLVFRGFIENYGENCSQIITDFLHDKLEIGSEILTIQRAHRLGRKNVANDQSARTYQKRPIIVNFQDFRNVELIMSRVTFLKNTPFSIDYDMPREIQTARSALWPQYKQEKAVNPHAKVQIVYPAKLLVNGTVVRDEFPDWGRLMSKSRLTDFRHIPSVRPTPNLHKNPIDPAYQHREVYGPHNVHTILSPARNVEAMETSAGVGENVKASTLGTPASNGYNETKGAQGLDLSRSTSSQFPAPDVESDDTATSHPDRPQSTTIPGALPPPELHQKKTVGANTVNENVTMVSAMEIQIQSGFKSPAPFQTQNPVNKNTTHASVNPCDKNNSPNIPSTPRGRQAQKITGGAARTEKRSNSAKPYCRDNSAARGRGRAKNNTGAINRTDSQDSINSLGHEQAEQQCVDKGGNPNVSINRSGQ